MSGKSGPARAAEAFAKDPGWLDYHPNPTKPAFLLPRGAVDAHCHVFGPGHAFPYAPERRYTPCDAGKDALWRLRDFLGVSRNVIVQATCHGADNRAMLDALASSGGRARGVATVTAATRDAELERLNSAGVRGVRFNFVKRLVDSAPKGDLLAIAGRVAALGWHIVIYFEARDLPELYPLFTELPGIVVVDHMGRPDLSKPADGPEFGLFTRLLRERPNTWAKVTCPERLSRTGPPGYADFVPFARRLVEEFPDRVLWGTDWPHPNLEDHMPDDGHLVDLIPRIAPRAEPRRNLLVGNPMRLYWPEEAIDGN